MKQPAILLIGLVFGLVLGHFVPSSIAAAQTNPDATYTMFVTSQPGSWGYLLNTRTGAVRFCNAANATAVQCIAVQQPGQVGP